MHQVLTGHHVLAVPNVYFGIDLRLHLRSGLVHTPGRSLDFSPDLADIGPAFDRLVEFVLCFSEAAQHAQVTQWTGSHTFTQRWGFHSALVAIGSSMATNAHCHGFAVGVPVANQQQGALLNAFAKGERIARRVGQRVRGVDQGAVGPAFKGAKRRIGVTLNQLVFVIVKHPQLLLHEAQCNQGLALGLRSVFEPSTNVAIFKWSTATRAQRSETSCSPVSI